MSTLNRIAVACDEERETLIIRLAEMAGILRSTTRKGQPAPIVCLHDCAPRCWVRFGWQLWCTDCGTPVTDAATWHRWLTEALRTVAQLAVTERRAA